MAKRGSNIYKRKDGRWEARYLKSIDKDGKRTYGSVYGKTFDQRVWFGKDKLSRAEAYFCYKMRRNWF